MANNQSLQVDPTAPLSSLAISRAEAKSLHVADMFFNICGAVFIVLLVMALIIIINKRR
ncbi:MAG: hypothetical protein ABF719_11640 [Acetobacter sp.]|uniref:hypothetical protein n=1 Tax=Acetobacter sp. TaxID=440 RepID=UPI0039EB327E